MRTSAEECLRSALMLCLLLMLTLSFVIPVTATEVTVSSVSALQTAINSAASGDVLVLTNGTYSNSTLNIGTSNITVRAQTPGGVFLNGTNNITISGNSVTFSGFQFTSGSITGVVITVTGNYNILTQLNFNGYSAQKYINIQGQYDEVSYCNFQNKPTSAPIGNLIHIAPNGTVPNYAKIRYCSFQNMPGSGGDNGNECIRIANGAQSTYLCRTIVEFCYFENTGPGDSEVISVKSRENVIRYNTNINNQGGNFCFRNGNDGAAYGNFFINAGGIRIKEFNNVYVYNNYFQNCGDGVVTAPVKYVYVSPNLKNLNFIHNTFIDGTPIELDNGATTNTWANNIFKKSSGNIFTVAPAGVTWSGNIYSGTLGVSIPSGMTNTDPQLVLNADGYYGLSSTSPAIDAASASYPAIIDIANIDDDPSLLFDISGQARPATATQKDVGADEYTTGGTTNRPLTLSNVGPSYLGGPGGGTKQDQTITFGALPAKVFGNADFAPGGTASSGLSVSYASSNTSVATIVGGNIHIVGAGSSNITASQAGDATYNPAPNVVQTLTVSKADQTITFNPLPAKSVGNADFSPGATASSGLAVSYASSNTSVATIVGGNIHIVAAGSAVITASQSGNTNYNAAQNVLQSLNVTAPVVTNYVPTSTTILQGALNSGTFSNLASNNASYYVVNSTTSGTRKTDWYGSVTISQTPAAVSKLTTTYDGKNSANKTQVLYLYNWSTAAWVQIDSRSVSSTDVTVTNVQSSPSNYISSTGVIRLRVYSSGGTKNYTASGDWIQFAVETPLAKQGQEQLTVNEPVQPKGFRLIGNYPNPFNPSTTVQYEILDQAHVLLDVYDIRGAKVKELVNGPRSSGVHNAVFDASMFTSGVYYVRFSAIPSNGKQTAVQTIKMILMK